LGNKHLELKGNSMNGNKRMTLQKQSGAIVEQHR